MSGRHDIQHNDTVPYCLVSRFIFSYALCQYAACRYGTLCGLYYKSFTIGTYESNDSGMYYKNTTVPNLDLARSHCKKTNILE